MRKRGGDEMINRSATVRVKLPVTGERQHHIHIRVGKVYASVWLRDGLVDHGCAESENVVSLLPNLQTDVSFFAYFCKLFVPSFSCRTTRLL